MATQTLSESPAVQRQYLAQLALTSMLIEALRQMWTVTAPLGSATGLSRFREGVQALMGQMSLVAASQARDYYLAVRSEALTGAPSAQISAADPVPRSKVDAGLDWALRARKEAEEYEAAVLSRVERAMQKAFMDVTREQIVEAVEGDEYAIGYRRVPRPDACSWCLMLGFRKSSRVDRAVLTVNASRDQIKYDPDVKHYGVYKSRSSAGQLRGGDENRYHNDCNCVVEPVFFGVEAIPDWLAEYEHLYDTFDEDEFGTGLSGFRAAVKAERDGQETTPPNLPPVVAPNPPAPQIAALLDRLAEAMSSTAA